MLDQIESMVQKEVNNRIKKMDLIPCEYAVSLVKQKWALYLANRESEVALINKAITETELAAEIKALLQLIESNRMGAIRDLSLAERVGAL